MVVRVRPDEDRPRVDESRGREDEQQRPAGGRSVLSFSHPTDYGLALFPQHAAMLAESTIAPEHAYARGYVSVDTKTRLEKLGVTRAGRNVPGLLVPQLRKDASTWGWQYRPDSPRLRDGKTVKYETPTGQRNGVDVPPGVGPLLDDPAVPLLVTEGVKKADAAACAGLACVALPGVWSWRGRNDHGGKTAVPDWHDVALNDRRLVLAYDSDVMVKAPVRKALDELAGYLRSKGAAIEYLHLPDLGDGKCGLDDFLAAGHTVDELWALVRPDPPEMVESPSVAESAGTMTARHRPAPTITAQARPTKVENGAELLDDVAAWIKRYLAVPAGHYITVMTLWAAHTWIVEAFYVTPRLIIDSAEPESGKTRVLELLNLICRAPIFTMNTTIAALYRRLTGTPRTILLDETDAIFAKGAAQNHEDLRALLDSGYKRGATVDRCVGEGSSMEVKEFPAFAPAALAGIAGNMPDTITTRAVTLSMRRRSPDEEIDEFIEEDVLAQAEPLRARLEAWAAQTLDNVRGARPVMPDGVRDRKAEVWRALLAAADAAGSHWPDKARKACQHFVLDTQAEDASIGVRLLTDLLDVFRDETQEIAPGMWTDSILERLNALDEAPWGNWYSRTGKSLDARGLAKLLKKYRGASGERLSSKPVRIGEAVAKGYRREDLWDPWVRYGVLSRVSDTRVTRVTPLASAVTLVTHVTHTGPGQPEMPLPTPTGNGHPPACRRCDKPNPDAPRLCDSCMADLHHQAHKRTP